MRHQEDHMPSRRRFGIGALLLTLLMLFSTMLVACGGQSGANASNAIVVDTGPTGDYTRDFNPFTGSGLSPSQGMLYEPLLYTNLMNSQVQPWLASSYKVASDAKSVTFTLRSGVTWTDGKPLTADDVVFTFNLMHQYPGLDVNAVWSYIKSVEAPDDHTVTITYNAPNSSTLYYIGSRTWIVPKHLWSNIGDPTKYANPDPVGTGPFTLKSFSSQNLTLTKNPHYWQAGKPAVQEVQLPASNDNSGIELKLYSNKTDWSAIPVHDVQHLFVDRDKEHHHYWFPPIDSNMFLINQAKAPFNDLAVRQAISVALDRAQMSKVAEQGYEPISNPTGIVPSQQKQFMDPTYANATFTFDKTKATQLLESDGYKKGSDGIYQKDGKKLSFKINVISGFSDWEALCQIASQNLKAVGMDVAANSIGPGDMQSKLSTGDFDLAIVDSAQAPSPYFAYNSLMNSQNTAPLGQAANSNYGRWKDATTDKLLNQYATTLDPAAQKQAMAGLEKIMVEQLPVIPLLYSVVWSEFNSQHFTGWADSQHPYATGGNYFFPDLSMVLLHLQPATGS